LAERWEFPDPKTIIFYLRKGIKFHDGTDFNAEAVKFNVDRIQDPTFRGGWVVPLLTGIKVEVVDKYTVKYLLPTPDADFITTFETGTGQFNSPTAVQKLGKDYTFKPVGTGPFKFKDFVPGASVTLVRNDEYWRKDEYGNKLPYLDRITISIIKEEAVVSAALETGQIDIGGIPVMDLERFEANPNITIQTYNGAAVTSLLVFNVSKPPMDNVNLRRAVAYACDPEAINKGAYYGRATVAKGGMWPIGTWIYEPTLVPRPYYDPMKAKEYLQLGGKPGGFSMDVLTWTEPSLLRAAEIMKDQLSKVGINISLKIYDVGTATRKFYVDTETALFFTGWTRRPQPSVIPGYAYIARGYFNAGKVSTPEMEELIVKGKSTYDLEQRKAIYRRINDIALNECWYVPLLYTNYYIGAQKYVKGFERYFGSDARPRLHELWFAK